jgi:dTDP-4-amino-4,6-dideoxygalactose transaminase
MIDYNPVTKTKGECIAVGRGAVAIFLALRQLSHKAGKVVVPANICYAAIFPILYTGYEPLFCDVDPYTGNITMDNVATAYDDSVVAVIAPHMYGNPISELTLIAQFCKEHDAILIEDCASMMGGNGNGYLPGTVGDYVVYSTGYSKTIDLGFGGLLFSSRYSLKVAEELEQKLPFYQAKFAKEWNVFSKLYRVIRNEGQDAVISQTFYKSLPESCKESFIFTIDEEKKKLIFDSISNLSDIIKKRRKSYELYRDYLYSVERVSYKFENNAVPWRYNLLIDEEVRQNFIDYCLCNSLPISDWYPCVTPIFGDDKEYPGALWHEKHIVNFPLLIDEQKIKHICKAIIEYFER